MVGLTRTLANASSPNRSPVDWYATPPAVTDALLRWCNIPLHNKIWEPASGDGRMAEQIKSHGYEVKATTLHDLGYGEVHVDFLDQTVCECDWIITNPPFSISVEFIKKCLGFGVPFALFLKSQYWHAASRLQLFMEHRPKAILPLSWRPDFCYGTRGNAPTMDTLWCVWDRTPADYCIYEPLRRIEPKDETTLEEWLN